VIFAAYHTPDARARARRAEPVTIDNNVWIGGSVTIQRAIAFHRTRVIFKLKDVVRWKAMALWFLC